MNARAAASAALVRNAAQRLLGKRETLAQLGEERVIAAVCRAVARLMRADDAFGKALRADARVHSRLSPEMIEWCLTTTLDTLTPGTALALLDDARSPSQRPAQLCAVVLAGNVFTAAMRALALPLLTGAPVLAKAASDDDSFAHHFSAALSVSDADVGACLEVARFERSDDAALSALLEHADVVSIYGDDSSVAQISAHAAHGARLVQHGHGVSAAYVSHEHLDDPAAARATAERLALDVAAYDQRGCLSPVVAYVESGTQLDAADFAELLSAALIALERTMPRGLLTPDEKAASMQWRAAASARGDLFTNPANPTSGVSYESTLSLRPTPGARHIAIHDCTNESDLITKLSPLRTHLESLGVSASPETRARLATHFNIHTCPVGQMQTPPLAALADGLPPLHGLLTTHL